MARTFLSYTSKDNVKAQQVYDDLNRSGYDVWSYEVDAKPGENYETKYETELLSREYFCLLDSPNARNSKHVHRECDLAMKRRASDHAFRIIPCIIVEKSRDWWELNHPLDDPKIEFVSLAPDHNAGMTDLCWHMGRHNFFPFSELAEDNEFIREISDARVSRDTYNHLKGLYQQFREDRGANAPNTARNWINTVISTVEKLPPNKIATPWVALGVLEGALNNHVGAAEAFKVATRKRPDYPRAWAASGGANMAIGKYRCALADYRECLTLLLAGHVDVDNLPMVVFGIAQSLLQLGDRDQAARELDKEWEKIRGDGHILELRARLHLENAQPHEALKLLEEAESYFKQSSRPTPVGVSVTLARTYHELRRKKDEDRVVREAVDRFEKDPEALRSIVEHLLEGTSRLPLEFLRKAVEIAPDSFIYRAELASLLYANGDTSSARAQAEPCRWLEDKLNRLLSPRERYYQGLACYVLGESELASHYRMRAARQDAIIADWPPYQQLLGS